MRPQPFLLALLALLAPACNGADKQCGAPFDGGAAGIRSTVGSDTFTYGNFTAIHAGDCGRESITIDGTQIDPTAANFHLVLCVQRADHIGGDPLPLAGDFADGVVELVDASAHLGDCTIAVDFAAAPQGTATFAGYCDDSGMSFNLTLDGTVAGNRTCGLDAGTPTPTPVTIQLSGTATLLAQ